MIGENSKSITMDKSDYRTRQLQENSVQERVQ